MTTFAAPGLRRATVTFLSCLSGLLGGLLASSVLTSSAHATPCQQDLDCVPSSSNEVTWCHQGDCIRAPRNQANCRWTSAPPFCWFDQDCPDDDANTVTWCHRQRCHRAQRNEGGSCQPANTCTRDRDCDDDDFATQDWCNQGQCVHASKTQAACRVPDRSCDSRRDCLDQDPSTIDWCIRGACARAPRNSNGQCTSDSCAPRQIEVLNSRRGAVNNPALGDRRWKVPADSYQIRYALSRSGNSGPVTLSYHCFDLASVSGRVLSARIDMGHPGNSYQSADAFETVVFRPMERERCDAQLDVTPFSAPANVQSIFDDLNDGPVVAQFQATFSDNGKREVFDVLPLGVSQLQNLVGTSTPWGLGGGLSTADLTPNDELERVFRGSDNSQNNQPAPAKLILTVVPAGCP